MHSPKIEHFLDEVIDYVKFPYDRRNIRKELEGHMLDRVEDYTEQGLSIEAAEQRTIEAMGSAKEIGLELNREHNPILGWVWKLTNTFVILLVVVLIFIIGGSVILTLDSSNLVERIPKSEIIYRIDLKKTVKIDDTVINFTNYVLDKEGHMHIFYEYYDTKLLRSEWILSDLRNISDNYGNNYRDGSCSSSGRFIRHCETEVNNFAKSADTLIISYDNYNRTFKVKIPLKAGDIVE